MLIEFTVGNYCSFRDPVTFSLVAAKLASKDKLLDAGAVIALDGQPSLLTSAVVYGPNAGGKSNLITALAFMRRFVLSSAEGSDATGGIRVEPFRLNPRTVGEPSHFEIVFVIGNQRYRYGFEATAERVHREWLYTVPTRTEALLFERRHAELKLGPAFREGRKLDKLTRPNALFLSVAAQFNGPIAQDILSWFRRCDTASGLMDLGMQLYTARSLVDGKSADSIVNLITRLDLGILDVKAEAKVLDEPSLPADMPEELRTVVEPLLRFNKDNNIQTIDVKTVHQIFDDSGEATGTMEFDMVRDESAGTQKLFQLAGPLIRALAEGRILIVDELDSSLHPALTREIVKLFNNAETNPKHAQLIFSTQDLSLLANDLFRRDQVWFVEKDSKGVSQLYSLAEFRGVRNDLALAPSYMRGRFGAIPYLDDLGAVLHESREPYGT